MRLSALGEIRSYRTRVFAGDQATLQDPAPRFLDHDPLVGNLNTDGSTIIPAWLPTYAGHAIQVAIRFVAPAAPLDSAAAFDPGSRK